MQDILDIINKSRNILNWKEIRFNYFDFIFCHHIYLEIIAVINYVFFYSKTIKMYLLHMENPHQHLFIREKQIE